MAVTAASFGLAEVATRTLMHPVSLMSAWKVCHTGLTTADNGGSTVVAPLGITRAECYRVMVAGLGTILQMAVQYSRTESMTTDPIVQVFGIDQNGIVERLKDGSAAHELTFADAATDVDDGATYETTDSQEVDLNGSYEFIVAVKRAAVLSGGSARLIARVK